jgi:hypothetical protein
VSAAQRIALWTGVFAAPLAWALHLVVGYWFEEAACSPGSRGFFAHEHLAQILLTSVALALACVGLASALWTYRAARSGDVPDPRGRVAFLGVFGAGGGLLFLAVLALAGTYAIVLDPCTAS